MNLQTRYDLNVARQQKAKAIERAVKPRSAAA
jgi:plasmid maintenance system antidote protein VapI